MLSMVYASFSTRASNLSFLPMYTYDKHTKLKKRTWLFPKLLLRLFSKKALLNLVKKALPLRRAARFVLTISQKA
jgi:hypothetical protein